MLSPSRNPGFSASHALDADVAGAKTISPRHEVSQFGTLAGGGSTGATENLIVTIEAHYHVIHRRELPELVRLARRVETLHGAHAMPPTGIAALFQRMATKLADHMQTAERSLFPLMRQGGHPMLMTHIEAAMADHDAYDADLDELERVAHGFETPLEASPTWWALYAGARKLTIDLKKHIHLENNELFPRFMR